VHLELLFFCLITVMLVVRVSFN